jgi:hypothetical protein
LGVPARLSEEREDLFWRGVQDTERFFMGDAPVQLALRKLTRLLDQQSLPYAVLGAMALNEYGYQRATVDVDILLTPESLALFKARNLGLGYVERFPGSRGLRDTEHGVDIDMVVTGGFPGDGKPKPIAFPDPAVVAERGARVALLPLPTLVELKLASGMTAPHRIKDLADVVELIRAVTLPATLAAELHPYVREKYLELWQAAQGADPL